MGIAPVSSKYQIVIPKEVRKNGLETRTKSHCRPRNGVVHLIPEKPIKKTRGFVKGITTENLRHEGDHL